MLSGSAPPPSPFGDITVSPFGALLTLVVLPLVYFAFKRIRAFAQEHLKAWLDAGFWFLGKSLRKSLATRASARQYARVQRNKPDTRYLQVPGREPVPLETDRAFVPLNLEGGTATARQSALNDDEPRVRIVGDPGAGKSSLVKYLFRQACRELDFRYRSPRLPILIELKRFSPPDSLDSEVELADWGLGELRSVVTSVEGFDMGGLFDSHVQGNGLLVLLDGLDEVASDAYGRTANAINVLSRQLADLSPANRIVLTMRTQFHQQVRQDFADSFPIVYRVAPFSPGDIFEFLSRWPFKTNSQEQVLRIYNDLTDRPTLREMCRNPLVLAMYVASDQRSEGVVVPDTRTTFYDQVVEELLVARRSRQLGVGARKMLREQREALLGRLALENLTDTTQAANSLDWRRAVALAMSELKCSSEDDAEEALLELASVTGIIGQERERESLRFIHLTFCEFLAAKEAAVGTQAGWPDLLGCWKGMMSGDEGQLRTRLNEVIPFAVGLLPRSQRHDAMDQVAEAGNDQVVARCLLETQAYDGTVFDGYVDREANALLGTPGDEWDARWLERLHLLSVVLQDADAWASLTGRTAQRSLSRLFEDLAQSDRQRLGLVFGAYSQTDPAAAYRLAEVCGVSLVAEQPDMIVDNCVVPPFLSLAVDRLAGPLERAKWIALLSEAALRQSGVAYALGHSRVPPDLLQEVTAMPRENRWYGPSAEVFGRRPLRLRLWGRDANKGVPQTDLMGALLTLALSNKPKFDGLDLLAELRELPGPSATLVYRVTRAATVAVLAIFLASAAYSWVGMDRWVIDLGFVTLDLGNRAPSVFLVLLGLALARVVSAIPGVRMDLYSYIVYGHFASYRARLTLEPYSAVHKWRLLVSRVLFGHLRRVTLEVSELRDEDFKWSPGNVGKTPRRPEAVRPLGQPEPERQPLGA